MTLVTVRPGPALHVFTDGVEVVAVELRPEAAMTLVRDLLREMDAAWARKLLCGERGPAQ